MRVYWVLALVAIEVIGANSIASAQATTSSCQSFEYVNHNQVDPPPLSVRRISGRLTDPNGVAISEGCVGLFTERDRRLVATGAVDESGSFRIKNIRPGNYRLLVHVRGFCTANVRVHIGDWPGGGVLKRRKLVVHMDARGIDRCSYVDYK